MKVMRAGFASQCGVNQAVDVAVFAQGCAQVDMIVLAEAHIDAAFDGQAYAVARRAEIVAERRDQPERDRAVLDREIARRATGAFVDGKNGMRIAQRRDEMMERDIMIAAIVRDLAERHRLDEREVAAGLRAIIEHGEQLILVESSKRDHVDLDRQPGRARRLDPAQRDIEVADARDMPERRRIEGVEAHVDTAHPCRRQHRRMFGKPHRVGRQRELVEAVADQRPQSHRERVDTAPHERLAAGQADAADAACDETLGKFGHFLDAEHRRPGQEGHVFGHAITAAQVAAVGDRQAQVTDPATKSVD